MYSELQSTQRVLACAVLFLLIALLPHVAPTEQSQRFTFDFVVIGWISEGSIVAKRLSENPNWNVLVLQPGVYVNSFEFLLVEEINETSAHQLRWPRLNHEHSPEHYVRGVPQDYDLWLQKGNHGWGWNDLLPYFEKSVGEGGMPESYVVLKEPETGNQDFQDLEKIVLSKNASSKSQRLHHTAETGFCDLPYTEVRKSQSRPNYFVSKNAEAVHINLDASGQRVESVDFAILDRDMTVYVKKELVLSAGAIESAKLLMLSGIGNKEHLNSLNIRVLHDLPVGKNLKDHITLPLFFTTPIVEDFWEEELSSDFIEERHGPSGIQGLLSLTEFVNTVSGDKSTSPDIEYHYFFIKHHDLTTLRNKWKGIAYLDWQFYNALESQLLTANLIIVQAVLVHPKSTGSVELRTDDFMYRPKILANYLNNAEDVKTLLRSIYYVENIFKNPNSFWSIELLKPSFSLTYPESCTKRCVADVYWRSYIKNMLMPKLSPVGTVKMGPNKNDSCVNPDLLLHGVQNLRVADASIMPDIPSSEIKAATMMIAEKAADLIKEEWK